MAKAYSLKARQHYGSNSLDLTIPNSICKEHGISDGDVFILEITKEKIEGSEKLVLQYKRVFSQKKNSKEI
jgi:bifunctional DNA-binding transcriptional regulator/antitoxin component of YhaV-PrlF toxin-antitoxin module